MESFTDCSEGTNDDRYKHNVFLKTYSMIKWASVIIIVINRNGTGRFVRFYALQKKSFFDS